jgi:hypothetical protein
VLIYAYSTPTLKRLDNTMDDDENPDFEDYDNYIDEEPDEVCEQLIYRSSLGKTLFTDFPY